MDEIKLYFFSSHPSHLRVAPEQIIVSYTWFTIQIE